MCNDMICHYIYYHENLQALMMPERMEAIAHLPGVAELLHRILVREAPRRPTLPDCAKLCEP